MSAEYTDDRNGMMRVHIAHDRARLACSKFTRAALNEHASAHGVPTGHRHKRTLAWYMAQAGLIDSKGYLRDGFPS